MTPTANQPDRTKVARECADAIWAEYLQMLKLARKRDVNNKHPINSEELKTWVYCTVRYALGVAETKPVLLVQGEDEHKCRLYFARLMSHVALPVDQESSISETCLGTRMMTVHMPARMVCCDMSATITPQGLAHIGGLLWLRGDRLNIMEAFYGVL